MLSRTNTQLLQALADSTDQAIWSEFDGRYRPVLEGFARRLGLGEEEAAEAAQATLAAFAEEYRAGRYQRERGSLRGWLFTIARTRIAAVHRARERRREERGASAFEDLADETTALTFFEEEWRHALLTNAFEELRSSTRIDARTLRTFELLVLQQQSPQAVAEEQGISTAAVYVAKHRCLERLRGIVARLEEDF